MQRFRACVQVALKKKVFDGQAHLIETLVQKQAQASAESLRVTRNYEWEFEASDAQEAEAQVQSIGSRILSNPQLEDFTATFEPVEASQ